MTVTTTAPRPVKPVVTIAVGASKVGTKQASAKAAEVDATAAQTAQVEAREQQAEAKATAEAKQVEREPEGGKPVRSSKAKGSKAAEKQEVEVGGAVGDAKVLLASSPVTPRPNRVENTQDAVNVEKSAPVAAGQAKKAPDFPAKRVEDVRVQAVGHVETTPVTPTQMAQKTASSFAKTEPATSDKQTAAAPVQTLPSAPKLAQNIASASDQEVAAGASQAQSSTSPSREHSELLEAIDQVNPKP